MSQKQAALVQRSHATHTRSKDRNKVSLGQSSRQVLGLQPALEIGKPNDKCEQQADSVADSVMRSEQNITQKITLHQPQLNKLQAVESETEESLQAKGEEEESLQAKENKDEQLQAKLCEKSTSDKKEPLQAKIEPTTPESKKSSLDIKSASHQPTADDDRQLQAELKEEREEEQQPLAEFALQAQKQPAVAEKEKNQTGQAKPTADVPAKKEQSVPAQLLQNASNKPGEPLNEGLRDKMESAFGADFSAVRVHTDQDAIALNRRLGARALTSGEHIYFNSQQFLPNADKGRHLLAHELTHTLQQQKAKKSDKTVSPFVAEKEPSSTVDQQQSATAQSSDTTPSQPTASETPAPVSDGESLGAAVNDDVKLELPDVPTPPPLETAAKIDSLSLEGSSDSAVSTVAQAAPSQVAQDGHKLGGAVSGKLKTEQQEEMNSAPVLQVNLSGNVQEGITPADQLTATSTELPDEKSADQKLELVAEPHKNNGAVPSNASNNQQLDQKSSGGGFLDWLKAHIGKFMTAIRTSDHNVNTHAGAKQRVNLKGDSDPSRMAAQRKGGGDKLRDKRDELTDKFKQHPGQKNIQAKQVQQSKAVKLTAQQPTQVETIQDNAAQEYADAQLPKEVRDKADEKLVKGMKKRLDKADSDAKGAVQTRDTEKSNAIADAEQKTQAANQKADADQRTTVIDNRKKVSDQQKQGIKQAYDQVNSFEKDAGDKQKANNISIKEQVKSSEEKADAELKKGEEEAEEKKRASEKEAREKKAQLKREQKNQSWWDRAKNAVKSAVKAITAAIDKVFTVLRDAVKSIINKAKELAVKAINAARNYVVNKLNDFRDWAKKNVNKYLGEHFPGIAAAINNTIDGVVDVAVAGVNMVADGAIAAVEAVAGALTAALDKILSVFQAVLKAAVQIIGAVLTGDFVEALKIAIRTGCEIAGINPQPIFEFFERAGNKLVSILKSPGKFFNNLVTAIGMGVRGFVKNIKQHLIKGLIGWLTGTLSEANITLPEVFDVKGIFDLVMQVLGLTYANIKARIIKRYPKAEKVIGAIEKGVEIIHMIVTKGPIALWEMVKKSMANLKEMVVGAIRNFVITTVIKEAVTWLLGLLNPAGALVKILKLLFDLVMFFVERFQQIKDFILSVYGAIVSIASGSLGKAAAAVENAMAKSLPVVIGLLASLAGLSGIGKTIQEIIKKVTKPINKVIDKVIEKVVVFAKKVLKSGKDTTKKVKDKLVKWWNVKRKFKAKNGETHTLLLKGSGKSSRLMIRSSETSYQNFLSSLDVKDYTKKEKTHLKNAKATAKKIDKEKQASVAGSTKEQKEANAKAKQNRLDNLLLELGKDTGPLFADKLPKWHDNIYGSGANSAGFGSFMEAPVLAKKMPGWEIGSSPTQSKHTVYDVLNQRRQAKGASFYIRGHLLNDNVGGPGKWKNMTPLSRAGNHQHEAQVESFVKSGFNSGAVLRYKVVPKYVGHGDGSALKKGLRKKHPTQADTFDKIIDAEEQVPTQLDIQVATLHKVGDEFKDKKVNISKPVLNPIERSVDKYFLSDSPRIETVNLRTVGSAQPLIDLNHQTLTANAGALYMAINTRRSDDEKGWFASYQALSDATGGSVSSENLTAWNKDGYIQLK